MESTLLQKARAIYQQYIEPAQFEQIDHVPDQFMPSEIALQQKCLCITHSFFNVYYPPLIWELTQNPCDQNHWVAETLLIMNGENDKAWNLKKELLAIHKLDIERQLRFNAAICYKNKKSSSYYDYRLKLFQSLSQGKPHPKMKQYYQRETTLIAKILGRFLRNYYCWMYRNKLLKLMVLIGEQGIIEVELESLHKFLELNPNDYSAYSRLIAVVVQHGCKLESELGWLEQLEQFCKVAYTHQTSYQHIYTYKEFLLKQIKRMA